MPRILFISIFLMITGRAETNMSNADIPDSKSLTTVSQVDLTQYVGLWYEIAKLPNPFQRKCIRNTTAEYHLKANGKIRVINRCETTNGDTISINGVAKVADKESNAKLKVSFVNILGINLFWGNYWIIGLGDHYQYALVGEPARKYGWVLSRTPRLTVSDWQEINATLTNQGYDPDAFVKTTQE